MTTGQYSQRIWPREGSVSPTPAPAVDDAEFSAPNRRPRRTYTPPPFLLPPQPICQDEDGAAGELQSKRERRASEDILKTNKALPSSTAVPVPSPPSSPTHSSIAPERSKAWHVFGRGINNPRPGVYTFGMLYPPDRETICDPPPPSIFCPEFFDPEFFDHKELKEVLTGGLETEPQAYEEMFPYSAARPSKHLLATDDDDTGETQHPQKRAKISQAQIAAKVDEGQMCTRSRSRREATTSTQGHLQSPRLEPSSSTKDQATTKTGKKVITSDRPRSSVPPSEQNHPQDFKHGNSSGKKAITNSKRALANLEGHQKPKNKIDTEPVKQKTNTRSPAKPSPSAKNPPKRTLPPPSHSMRTRSRDLANNLDEAPSTSRNPTKRTVSSRQGRGIKSVEHGAGD